MYVIHKNKSSGFVFQLSWGLDMDMVSLYLSIELITAVYAVDTEKSFNELLDLIKMRLCYLLLHCKFDKPLSFAVAIPFI